MPKPDDLVARLRADSHTTDLLLEAADRIEVLEKALDEAISIASRSPDDELVKLRALLDGNED